MSAKIDTGMREFVQDCLVRFDRADQLQLATQRASAEASGMQLPEVAVPPSCLMPHPAGAPCDLFDVELALILFDRQQRRGRKH